MTEPIRTRVSYDGNENRPQRYPDLPEPLTVGTYDNHTHLEIADGDSPLSVSEQLERMRQVRMLGAVQVGVTLESSKWSADQAEKEPMLLAAVALHPNEAPLNLVLFGYTLLDFHSNTFRSFTEFVPQQKFNGLKSSEIF